MMLAQVTTQQVIDGFGLPAAIVIVSLAVALIFSIRLLLKAYDRINEIQETRIADARETRDKLSAPMEAQAKMTGQIYDLLLNLHNQRGA